MGTKGSFDLPTGKEQSCSGARRAYRAMWQRDWPHDDAYLRQLARDVPPGRELWPHDTRCNFLLFRMRECHEFE